MQRCMRYCCGSLSTKSPVFRVCETGDSPNLPLTGDTLVTDEGFLIFELISCDIQRNCTSSFENLHVLHVFMREYSVVIFAKNDFDP